MLGLYVSLRSSISRIKKF